MIGGFSKEWEKVYSEGRHQSSFPWSDLVSMTHRYGSGLFYQKPSKKVLELGCGAGANVPLFLSRGIDYTGIDGSPTAIRQLENKYPDAKFIAGDFTKDIPYGDGSFDMVVDRASITCVETRLLPGLLERIYDVLKPGGLLICVDLYSTQHPSFIYSSDAERIDDSTINNPTFGSLKGLGTWRFWDRPDIDRFFKDFNILYLQFNKADDLLNNGEKSYASYDLVVVKR